MSRKLNKEHGFLVGIHRQLQQQAAELGLPPVTCTGGAGNGAGATAAVAVDEASIHVADELSHLQLGVEADASGAGDGATAAAAVDEASIHVADELSHLQPGLTTQEVLELATLSGYCPSVRHYVRQTIEGTHLSAYSGSKNFTLFLFSL